VTAQRKALDERNEDFCKAPLSQVIRMALEDLEAVEKNPDYRINMEVWHAPRHWYRPGGYAMREVFGWSTRPQCAVCLGGSVIANRFGADINRKIIPDDQTGVDPRARDRVIALDAVRRGNFAGAADKIKQSFHAAREATAGIYVPPYSRETRDEFKAALRLAADRLEKAGL
jgi:hypothetical protein